MKGKSVFGLTFGMGVVLIGLCTYGQAVEKGGIVVKDEEIELSSLSVVSGVEGVPSKGEKSKTGTGMEYEEKDFSFSLAGNWELVSHCYESEDFFYCYSPVEEEMDLIPPPSISIAYDGMGSMKEIRKMYEQALKEPSLPYEEAGQEQISLPPILRYTQVGKEEYQAILVEHTCYPAGKEEEKLQAKLQKWYYIPAGEGVIEIFVTGMEHDPRLEQAKELLQTISFDRELMKS